MSESPYVNECYWRNTMVTALRELKPEWDEARVQEMADSLLSVTEARVREVKERQGVVMDGGKILSAFFNQALSFLSSEEWLIMEVLAARFRLGYSAWHIDKRASRSIEKLIRRGWIVRRTPFTEDVETVALTENGVTAWNLDGPLPPA